MINSQQQQRPTKILKQSNLDGIIVESLDVEGFGDRFELIQSIYFTQVAFQNCGRQPQFQTSKKATDDALAMSAGKYDALLFAEYRLYSPTLESKHQMHDRVCVMNKGEMTRLSYNTNDDEGTKWNQYDGTGITLNANTRERMTKGGWGIDPTKLGKWTLTRIGGKDGIATVSVSAYRAYHNRDSLHTVWRHQTRYFKENEDIREPDVHALFIRDLCKFLGDF